MKINRYLITCLTEGFWLGIKHVTFNLSPLSVDIYKYVDIIRTLALATLFIQTY